jgi:hypothetical protein
VILIGTHHKTGTVWMRDLFSKIAELLEVPFLRLGPHEEVDLARLRRDHRLIILFQDHASFASLPLLAADRGAHVIRDPRDVLISSANYHSWSHEAWLHEARKSLRGRTYQQSISELDFHDSIRFEMQRSGGLCIGEMLSLDRGDLFADVRLEDLMMATRGEAAAWFSTLGFVGAEVEGCVEAFEATRIEPGSTSSIGLRQHVQNADCSQWRYLYDPALLASFREHFGDAAERLGYLASTSAMLIDDPVRRDAYLARFHANRGEMAEAWRLLQGRLATHPEEPLLVAVRKALIGRGSVPIDA